MIKIPTVLILGAGASQPYGFPTGPELKNSLCAPEMTAQLNETADREGIDKQLVSELIEKLRTGSHSSIDAMLEQRPWLIPIGKLAIARVLIQAEDEDRLLPPRAPNQDWYLDLGKRLISNGVEAIGGNRITIVTFNYDRSLEHRLARLLMGDFDLVYDAAVAHVSRIRIIHCHGTLGSLDVASTQFRPYRPDLSHESIRIAARSIRIIHDEELADQRFEEAIREISSAKRVYFLGFGYHPLNMQRLGVEAPGAFPWNKETKLFFNMLNNQDRARQWMTATYGIDIAKSVTDPGWAVQSAMCNVLPLD